MINDDKTASGAEILSALVDGEVEESERGRAVDRLLEDVELQERWRRHYSGRAALSGSARLLGDDFGERVSAAVAAEPAIVATPRHSGPTPGSGATPGWLRPVAGAAVAASVALVALGGLLTLRDGDLIESSVVADAGEQAATAATAQGEVQKVAASSTVQAEGSDGASRAEVRRRLSFYLGTHNEFAGAAGMPGVMPYSRQVGFNAGQ